MLILEDLPGSSYNSQVLLKQERKSAVSLNQNPVFVLPGAVCAIDRSMILLWHKYFYLEIVTSQVEHQDHEQL